MFKVPVGVFRRRVPGLVGIETVDPQEEGAGRVVVGKPLAGRIEHPGALVVVFVPPVALVEQVVDQPRMPGHVHGPPHVPGELRLDQPRIAAPPVVRFLPAHEIQVGESPGEVHGGLEHVVRVGDQGRQIPPLEQHLRDRVLFRRDLVPAGRMVPVSAPVEIVPPGEAPHPGKQRPAHL